MLKYCSKKNYKFMKGSQIPIKAYVLKHYSEIITHFTSIKNRQVFFAPCMLYALN